MRENKTRGLQGVNQLAEGRNAQLSLVS